MKRQALFLLFILFFAPPALTKTPLSDWDYYQKQGHRSSTWDALVEAGFDTFESENTNTSVNFLKRAAALGCKDGLVFYKLASIVEAGGNLKGALEMLQNAEPLLKKQYKNHPATKELSEHIAKIDYQLGHYDEALPKFLEAIETEGEDFLKLYLVGQIYRMGQKQKEAIVYFEKALGTPPSPDVPAGMKELAQIELMRLYFDTGAFDQSLAMADAILKDDPNNAAAISYRDTINNKRFQEKERKTMKEKFQ